MVAGQGGIYGRFLSDQEAERREKLLIDDKARRHRCLSFAENGTLKEHANECLRVPAGLSPELSDIYRAHLQEPKAYDASLAEDDALYAPTFAGLSEDDREEMAAARNYGNLPLTIMVAADNDRGAPERAWMASIDNLAARSTHEQVVAVPDSGHNIQLDQPDWVISLVREMVAAARLHPSGMAYVSRPRAQHLAEVRH